ncbi:putative glycosyl transferase [Thiorhodovibrio winogradskyi]|uniref:Glycosyl transferase n=1 Tax=Thiorhodovibrio winogradskyi TaxID=77007 RepID=A0ABZ0S716_9GAMM|nr:glycosyltransferase [Thiorhodovibrio winogradskyi]
MRNIKDELVYDPACYQRDALRAELGYGPEDRVILFGGLLREHKGVYELLRLLEHLDDRRYRLLFIASRPSPEQERLASLAREPGARVRVLPAQDRTGMARMNLAADVVILWLDPAVPASHYQMPYKATDALAMGTPIIANPISDLGEWVAVLVSDPGVCRAGPAQLLDVGSRDVNGILRSVKPWPTAPCNSATAA